MVGIAFPDPLDHDLIFGRWMPEVLSWLLPALPCATIEAGEPDKPK